MLEIIGVSLFFAKLRDMLAKKGRAKSLAFLGPVFWILGGNLGLFIKTDFVYENPFITGVIGMIIGSLIIFVIINSISPVILNCPSCNVTLSSLINRSSAYARIKCESCELDLKIQKGIVSIFKRKDKPKKKK